jgi:small-conductance mechanosensitive channel
MVHKQTARQIFVFIFLTIVIEAFILMVSRVGPKTFKEGGEKMETIVQEVTDSLTAVARFVPNILVALVILLVGILVAWAVKTIVTTAFASINLKKYVDRLGLKKYYPSTFNLPEFLGDASKWIIIIVFLVPTLEALQLDQTNQMVSTFVEFIPRVIAAVAILLVGVIIADLVSRAITGAVEVVRGETAKHLAAVAKWSILIFAFSSAFLQLGFEFAGVILTGLVFGLAGAFALAFGLGGQDLAKEVLSKVSKGMKK